MSADRSAGHGSQRSAGAQLEARYGLRVNGREVPLDHEMTTIGRGADCHIQLRDPLVSRLHARLVIDCEMLYLEDLGGMNGTFVNQEQIFGTYQLFPGDRIFIGRCALRVYSRASEPASGPVRLCHTSRAVEKETAWLFSADDPTPLPADELTPVSGTRDVSVALGEHSIGHLEEPTAATFEAHQLDK